MAVLAVTAEARSAVADAGAPVVVMPVGPEPVGPKTKGYAGSVTTLLCVGLVLAGASDWRALQAEVDATCEAIAGAMEGWDAAATALAGRHRRAGYLMLVAQGRHLGTAHEGALKITEMSGIPAGAFDLEEALHGRFHALDATTPALLLARSGPERETARAAGATLGALGVPHQVIAVGDAGGELDVRLPALRALPELDLLPAVVPLQWLARALAIARGMAPEAMRYPGLSARLGIKTPADAD
jgi:glucosamine--fructose-6-phosphate aminotransferase (isomerizing)